MGFSSTCRLSFDDHVHKLNAGQRTRAQRNVFEPWHEWLASLDRSMVPPDKVVEIFGLAYLDGRFAIVIDGFECGDIGAAFVDGHRLGQAIFEHRFQSNAGLPPFPDERRAES